MSSRRARKHEPVGLTAMSDEVFIIYAAEDRALASLIHRFFRRDHDVPCFMARRSIQPGASWLPTIFNRLIPCRLSIFLATPRSVASKWCFAELALAVGLNKPVLVARQQARDSDLPAFIASQTLPFETSAQQRRFLAKALKAYGEAIARAS